MENDTSASAGDRRNHGTKIVIVGAGPVGALAALYAAQRGYIVEVYELRADLRDASTIPLNFTKSINLALSERGTNAIHRSGVRGKDLLASVVKATVPMGGRMIHGKDAFGELVDKAQAYDVNGRALLAADRGELNKTFLDALEQFPNVKLFFNHKLTGADFKRKKAWVEVYDAIETNSKKPTLTRQEERNKEVEIGFDFIIGADGAYSATRFHMMKFVRMDYQQEYIDTLWCEFTIPAKTFEAGPGSTQATESSKWAISPNHLHIWPAKEFMFIAIPSLDCSFTCTLFLPSSLFETLESDPNAVPAFFDKHFPGVTSVIEPDALISSFLTNPHLPLISIKCSPYHYKDCAVIIGDAAHAMVPFYGQGMNAGLEDVNVLFELLDKQPSSVALGGHYDPLRAAALAEYSTIRKPDAYSINDLALQNYVEMRASVTSPLYKLRKWLEETLSVYAPSLGWQTQYSRVSFGNEPYAQIVKKGRRQTNLLLMGLVGFVAGPVFLGTWVTLNNFRRTSGRFFPGLFSGLFRR